MRIGIIPLGEVSPVVIDEIESVVRDRFATRVGVQSALDLPKTAYDRTRNQYDAEQIVDFVEATGNGDKNVAITPADLFFQDRNYIFGLAEFKGDSGVVSFNRLVQAANGSSVDPATAKERVRKEVVHEIGHLVGHRHCQHDYCVMSFSTGVPQIDNKRDRFCRSCRS